MSGFALFAGPPPILRPHASAEQAALLIAHAVLIELARLLEPLADKMAPLIWAEPDPDKKAALLQNEVKRISDQVDELTAFAFELRCDRRTREMLAALSKRNV